MNERSLHVGVVDSFVAQSFGEPGQRTFRLLATTESGEVSIWLEKEQLAALGEAIEQILERVPDSQGLNPSSAGSTATISGEMSAKAASLSLSFEESQDGFVLRAGDLFEATLHVESLNLLLDREQLISAADEIEQIIAGGRPRCSMCGMPLTEQAHFCPPSNGHARVQV